MRKEVAEEDRAEGATACRDRTSGGWLLHCSRRPPPRRPIGARDAQRPDLSGQDSRGSPRRSRIVIAGVEWDLAEPNKNTFRWGDTDQFVGGLAKQGIRPAPFFWGSPGGQDRWTLPTPASAPAAKAAWRTSSSGPSAGTARGAATGRPRITGRSAPGRRRGRSPPGRSGTSPT